ncbi:hypothetical protein TNCV_2067051 [Trichonephila clavipes]|uniref:Uncharacterized protein n=1 Tax=Trichonephila clavipes TaxID=2585209 RepID=A0A8X6W2T2_TRICX|nr:hypothetical protein TNCV_2067051 [Trichonephila clavipes]
MSPKRRCRIEVNKIRHGKDGRIRQSVATVLSSMQATKRFCSVIPEFKERAHWEAMSVPPLFSYHQPLERTFGSKDI